MGRVQGGWAEAGGGGGGGATNSRRRRGREQRQTTIPETAPSSDSSAHPKNSSADAHVIQDAGAVDLGSGLRVPVPKSHRALCFPAPPQRDSSQHNARPCPKPPADSTPGDVAVESSPIEVVVVWFKQDLRLHDNPALFEACKIDAPSPSTSTRRRFVVLVYIVASESEEAGWGITGAAQLWLHHSLVELDTSLRALGSRLLVLDGRQHERGTAGCLLGLVEGLRARAAAHVGQQVSISVFFNRVYEPWLVERDVRIQRELQRHKVATRTFKGVVLFEPWEAKPDQCRGACGGGFGSVGFFIRGAERAGPLTDPLPAPGAFPCRVPDELYPPHAPTIAALGLGRMPVGERGALEALDRFVKSSAAVAFEDKHKRFRADRDNTACISAHIRFGELSPRRVIFEVHDAAVRAEQDRKARGKKTRGHRWTPQAFIRRLMWRDLAYWCLWFFPHCPDQPLRPHFALQWWNEEGMGGADCPLRAWQLGLTGYPLVDAAMRQLWAWGWCPNYLRHVVASFLVEFMGIDWRHGEAWFHHTLVDADVAINSFMWQNGGHSGLDQWNFVMDPVNAAKSCDPEGEYVRQWVPELARLPVEFIHCPWEAEVTMLVGAGVRLVHRDALARGEGGLTHATVGLAARTYPHRIITDLEKARRRMHEAVLEVRRLVPEVILEDGCEAITLHDGRVVRLITRVDFREDSAEPVTRQTAAEAWDKRKRAPSDPMGRLLHEDSKAQEARRELDDLRRTVG